MVAPRSPTDVIRSVCDDAWLLGVTTRAAGAVTAPVWREAEAAWDGDQCRTFAAVAEALEGLVEAAHDTLGAAARALALEMGAPPWAAALVGWVVSSVALPGETSVRSAAQAIRVLGIALCVEKGNADCDCLIGFAHAESDELIADRLEAGLRSLAG